MRHNVNDDVTEADLYLTPRFQGRTWGSWIWVIITSASTVLGPFISPTQLPKEALRSGVGKLIARERSCVTNHLKIECLRENILLHILRLICQILIGRIILKGAPGKEHVLSRQWKNNLGHKKLLSVSIIFLSFFCGHESEFLTAVTSFCYNRTRTVSETFPKPTKLMGSNVFM